MMSLLPASISLRGLSASVAAVSVGAFLAGRQSLGFRDLSVHDLLDGDQAALPEEAPFLAENSAAMDKMMAGMASSQPAMSIATSWP